MKYAYRIVDIVETHILLEDKCQDYGCMSLTNAAELVIQDLLEKGLTSAGKKVYYIDTEGRIDELCHDGKRFTGYAPGLK